MIPSVTEQRIALSFTLNGRPTRVQVSPSATLLEVLRYQLNLTGTKEGCGEGECGACSVFVDGRLVNSCLVLAGQVEGGRVTTIEGLAGESGGKLHPMQQAFVDTGAVQCGFCIPGMVMSAVDLLKQDPQSDDETIRRRLAGNLCRCTGYSKIFEAVRLCRDRGKGQET